MTTPIEDRVQELTARYYRGLEVLQALDEPKTLDELTADLGLDAVVCSAKIPHWRTLRRRSM